MNGGAGFIRQVKATTAVILAGAMLAGVMLAACGSGSTGDASSSATAGSGSSGAQIQQEALTFARCMRSHGVSSFPDPAAGGGFDVNAAGINTSSPAFRAAQTACKSFAPVKRPPSGPPSPQAYTRLVHWASCMRAHGISGLPDPRPNPPPGPGSSAGNLYGTLMGDGGYWVGIPTTINAHSPAFTRLSTVCGESPDGHHG